MPLIDGIGDEVVQFGIAVIVVVVAILAWLSTNARPDRYRAVLFMRARGHHPLTVSIRTRLGIRSTRNRFSGVQTPAINLSDTRPPTTVDSSNQTENRVIPLQEMDSIVDADMAMMDNNRLHFYRRVEGPTAARSVEESESTSEASESHEEHEVEPASNAQIREMDSIVSAMEAELSDSDTTDTARCTDTTNSPSEANDNTTILTNVSNAVKVKSAVVNNKSDGDAAASTTRPTTETESNTQKILIKLKYINDTLKEVEGILDEPLKDFKCRHFSAELSAESRVRLIFNGRVLLDEAATLRACGLHHRAVVHCLVQPRRAPPPQPPNIAERQGTVHELVTEIINPERYWDLENILMTLVSLALTIIWFFSQEREPEPCLDAPVALH
ncbi:uncharacterized protein [Epargyreus clarus]|uniref:uncharacterized protein isoform X2 n=1 Tax=Epargyreus clarus TaxID=520877 RepID=UPI003C2BD850